jgi:hypothetical protein
MSFWEDASPVVKGAIVVGVLGIIAAVLLWTGVIGGAIEEPVTQERGLEPPPGS